MRLPRLSGLSRFWAWVLGASAVAVGVWLWFSGAAEPVQTTPVVQAYPSQTVSVLNATGYVVAQRKAALASKASGRLEWLGVAEGAVVKSGQLLAKIESQDVAAQLDQARAQVGIAKADLEEAQRQADRSASLLAQRFIAPSVHDTNLSRLGRAKATLAAAQAAEKVAEAALAQTEIRAPFDAVVLTKNANVGDNITPFSSAAESKGAVVTIADMSTLEVETDVSESNVSRLKIGQPAEIGLDGLPGERFAGEIVRMVPTIDRAKATRLVKVRFQKIDPRVLPDMSAKIVFLDRPLTDAERQPVIAVSRQAVLSESGKSVVFLVEGDRLKRLEISSTEAAQGELVPVPQLKPGQRVVIRPKPFKDGQKIRVVSS